MNNKNVFFCKYNELDYRKKRKMDFFLDIQSIVVELTFLSLFCVIL